MASKRRGWPWQSLRPRGRRLRYHAGAAPRRGPRDVEEGQEDQETEKGAEGAQGRIARAQIPPPQAHHGGKGQIAAATGAQAADAVIGAGTPGRRHAALDVHGIEKRLGRAQRRATLKPLTLPHYFPLTPAHSPHSSWPALCRPSTSY